MTKYILDLFCGAGGLSLGFEMAGFKSVLGIDFDNKCVETYSKNIGHAVLADISKIKKPKEFFIEHTEMEYVDAIIAGVPCQTFSSIGRCVLKSLGRNPIDDPRTFLWTHFMRFVEDLKPDLFVIENVQGMLSVKYLNQLMPELIAKVANDLGYFVKYKVLNSADYGVPQIRKRLFLVGSRISNDIPFPEKTTDTPVTVWEAISDLPIIPHGFRIAEMPYSPRCKLTKYQKMMRENAGNTLYNHVTRWHNEQDLYIFSILPEGGLYSDVPLELRRYRGKIFKEKYRKLIRNAPSWTIVANIFKDTRSYIYPSRPDEPEPPRTISVREAARLQSFPDTFIFPKSMTSAFKQIGNAVPPLMAKALAESLKSIL